MKICVTGGAGFIGVHTAERFASGGHRVVVFDNLSRRGAVENLEWLRTRHTNLEFVRGDVTRPQDLAALADLHPDIGAIIHLAGQVAVTSSVADPVRDFRQNAEGTLNVLELARTRLPYPIVLHASTNKVYGGMEGVRIERDGQRYGYADLPGGIPESAVLDFHSPYGCSKGAADQYVRDYARVYGLRTVVFRQSCIYGTRQFGIEDQGWVAWFTIAALMERPITIYGDGCQVRDVLYVDDLVTAYEMALARIDRTAGRIYNIGGGPAFSMSLLELLGQLEGLLGRPVVHAFDAWRTGDQRVYVSDITRAREELGWQPRTAPAEGVRMLFEWVGRERDLIRRVLGMG